MKNGNRKKTNKKTNNRTSSDHMYVPGTRYSVTPYASMSDYIRFPPPFFPLRILRSTSPFRFSYRKYFRSCSCSLPCSPSKLVADSILSFFGLVLQVHPRRYEPRSLRACKSAYSVVFIVSEVQYKYKICCRYDSSTY